MNPTTALKLDELDEKSKKNIEITQKITILKRKINEDEIHATIKEKEINTLIKDRSSMKINYEIERKQLDIIKGKVEEKGLILKNETKILEDSQEEIWSIMKAYIETIAEKEAHVKDMSKVNSFIKTRKDFKKNRENKIEVLKLKGEILGMQIFKNAQECKIKRLQNLLSYLTIINKNCKKNATN